MAASADVCDIEDSGIIVDKGGAYFYSSAAEELF